MRRVAWQLRPGILQREECTDLSLCALGDQDRIRRGERLQSCRQARRRAYDVGSSSVSLTDHITDDDEPAGDADAGLQAARRFNSADHVDEAKTGSYRSFGIIFVCRRIAEIGEKSIARKICDETVVSFDRVGASAVEGRHRIQQLFGIRLRC
jgi:hypothetical protein